jgi:hypothetical protein
MTGMKGLVPNNWDINVLKLQLADAIREVKDFTGAEKVDIVSHSMGGLVARAYIDSPTYRGDIGKLIMLGTPNRGASLAGHPLVDQFISPLWTLLGFAGGKVDLPETRCIAYLFIEGTIARCQMIPYSPFMLSLRHGYDTKGVQHFAVAGTESNPFTSSIDYSLLINPDDGIVTLPSVVGNTFPLWEYHTAHTPALGKSSYYTSQEVIDGIIGILETYFSGEGIGEPEADEPLTDTLQRIFFQGEAPQAGADSNTFLLTDPSLPREATPVAMFASSWETGSLSMTLVSPSGEIINETTYTSNPNITWYRNSSSTEIFTILSAPMGNWTVNLTSLSNSSTPYSLSILAATNLSLTLLSNLSVTPPGSPVLLQARLEDWSGPITGKALWAEVQKPDNSSETVALYDDGLHQDGLPDDGTYAGTFTNTTLSSLHTLFIRANGTLNGHEFLREIIAGFFVEEVPDLALNGLEFSDSKPEENQTIQITAFVRNIGTGEAPNATILFYDSDPALEGIPIGGQAITLPPGEAVNVTVEWNATKGFHTIVAFPSITNPFQDADYSNEKASASLYVTPLPPKKRGTGFACSLLSGCPQ